MLTDRTRVARTCPGALTGVLTAILLLSTGGGLSSQEPAGAAADPKAGPAGSDARPDTGNVIFLHPDGASVAHWGAARLIAEGPDGKLAWDRLERIGVYRGHLSNSLASSSHGGATAHAFGVKVPYDSYGMSRDQPITALSGAGMSVLMEAEAAGLATAVVNSGHIAEPGTGVFVASSITRANTDEITLEIIESGVDIILSGGEILLLPPEEVGRFGHPGVRRDGRNLIERARELGYEVVYTRAELMALPDETRRVLGVFGPGHTFIDRDEEDLAQLGVGPYLPSAPTLAEMTAKALALLSTRDRRFFLVAEEEGSDNFANQNNAAAALTALQRADDAFDVALQYIESHPNTMLVTTADSNAGGMQVWALRDPARFEQPLPPTTANGAPLDGRSGTRSLPFVAAPNAAGERLRFGIAWAGHEDMLGGIVARAHGLNAAWLPVSVDNTDIYRMLYATAFGTWLP